MWEIGVETLDVSVSLPSATAREPEAPVDTSRWDARWNGNGQWVMPKVGREGASCSGGDGEHRTSKLRRGREFEDVRDARPPAHDWHTMQQYLQSDGKSISTAGLGFRARRGGEVQVLGKAKWEGTSINSAGNLAARHTGWDVFILQTGRKPWELPYGEST